MRDRRLPSPTPTSSTAPSTSVSSHHRPRRKAESPPNGAAAHLPAEAARHALSGPAGAPQRPVSPPLKTFALRNDSRLPDESGGRPSKPPRPPREHQADLREVLDAERRRGQAGQDREQRLYARLKELKRREEERQRQSNGEAVEGDPLPLVPVPAMGEVKSEPEAEGEPEPEAPVASPAAESPQREEPRPRRRHHHGGHRHHRRHRAAPQAEATEEDVAGRRRLPSPDAAAEDHASASGPLPAFHWMAQPEPAPQREATPLGLVVKEEAAAEVEEEPRSRRRRADGTQVSSREKVEAWLRGTAVAAPAPEEEEANDVPGSSAAPPPGEPRTWAHLSTTLPAEGPSAPDEAESSARARKRARRDRSHRSPAIDRDGHRHSRERPAPRSALVVEPSTFPHSAVAPQPVRRRPSPPPPPPPAARADPYDHRYRPPSPPPRPHSTGSQRQAEGKADRTRDSGSARCYNCGSDTHGTRQCTHPIICAYCCFPGHAFRTCDERRLDERAGKPIPTDEALLEWCRRSHEVAEGPRATPQPARGGRHNERGGRAPSPAEPKFPAVTAPKGNPKSRPKSPKPPSRSRSPTPAHRASGGSSAGSDINAVMARTVARVEQRKKERKEGAKRRRHSRSPKRSKKRPKKGKRSRSRSRARSSPERSAPPNVLVAPLPASPPAQPAPSPAVDIRAQLKEQLQRLQPEKQLQLIQEQIRQRQLQQSASKAESAPEDTAALSLNAILNGEVKEEESADDDDLNAFLRGCAGPTQPPAKAPAAQPNGRSQSGKATPVVSARDTYDIFAETDMVPDLPTNGDDASRPLQAQAEDTRDAEGYYLPRPGELLAGRYRVQGVLGKGVFGVVVSAADTAAAESPEGAKPDGALVAIKIARSNPVMEAAAKKEVDVIQSLDTENPQERSKCVSILATFHHQNHYCYAMELLKLNLREFLKKYGTEEGVPVGLHLDAVRLYARDLFQALNCLERSGIFHGDVKPDNILVNLQLKGVRLCDFGTACRLDECSPTPYVCSRYYRAPEIILGLGYGPAADMWAAACTVYELYTGQILFKGETNNEMLKLFMALKGRVSNKLVKVAQFGSRHFDENFAFLHTTPDPVTKKPVVKKVTSLQPLVDLKALLRLNLCRSPDEKQRVLELADLLDRLLQLDPAARLTAEGALQHPFVTGRRQ
nr:Serine/threonine-protein kinase PRP4 [Euglena gracilis]